MNNFFEKSLEQTDTEIATLLKQELVRQQNHIELIASENIVSKAVLQAMGSVFTNKYAEGYPGKRYYHGCEYADGIETLAQERLKKLFNASFVNVQPHSGSQANAAVYMALLQPGDTVMGLSLDAGGHLTHGAKVSSSGKYYNAIQYGVNSEGLIDYDALQDLATEYKPKLIIAGGSAYARLIDFKRFREIADSVGAYLMVDMAHFAGLVAGKQIPNPLDYADVVTSTTHKTLRGPRGGVILTNKEELIKKFNSAIFPGLQGGPLMHVIAGKAVAFGEALQPEFQNYAAQVMKNAKALEAAFKDRGIEMVSGGTDTHLILIDLRKQGLKGNEVCDALAEAHIICNKNAVPNDPQKPSITSGLRVGTPAGTTRGFTEKEFRQVGYWIADIVETMGKETLPALIKETGEKVQELCKKFPIYEGGA